MKNPFLAAVVTLGVLGAAASSALAGPVAVGPQLAAAGQGAVAQDEGSEPLVVPAVVNATRIAVKATRQVMKQQQVQQATMVTGEATMSNVGESVKLPDPAMCRTLLPEAALDLTQEL